MFLVILLGVLSDSLGHISESLLEVTVGPGDNITLYCDCQLSSVLYIVWYRNCSHENQPSLVLKTHPDFFGGSLFTAINPRDYSMWIFPRFQFVRNFSSQSYDLMIINITDADEGLYSCGTERKTVENNELISSKYDHKYGHVTTSIIFNSSEPRGPETTECCVVCWMLLFSLCPAFALLSSLLSSLVVYHLCHKTDKKPHVDQQIPETRSQTTLNQDEDMYYAALEIRQASQKPRNKKTKSSDISTYSAINTFGRK